MTSFRLAPEWARQDAVILVWPSQHSDWALQENHPNLLSDVEQTYLELIKYLVRHQIVLLISHDHKHRNHIETLLSLRNIIHTNIRFVEIATNDTWVRDYGPISVQANIPPEKPDHKILDFNYDAWGEKYTYEKDNRFNHNLYSALDFNASYEKIDSILEAGNLEINNKGTLLTSSTCFKRNSSDQKLTHELMENKFHDWFGCTNICWIDDVLLSGDDTDGHVDNLARFCNDDVIVFAACGCKHDPNKEALQLLAKQLKTIAKHNANELIPLFLPDPIMINDHQLPASYANFLISNEYVFVPVFNDKRDTQALKTIDDCFPSREIIDIESNALIQQFGGIHCASMQIPQGCLL